MNFRRSYLTREWIVGAASIVMAIAMSADQVELKNGDRYVGKVVALSETNVTLRSEVNGLMRLPRNSVTVITLGDRVPEPVAAASLSSPAEPATHSQDLAAEIRAKGIDPKSI